MIEQTLAFTSALCYSKCNLNEEQQANPNY